MQQETTGTYTFKYFDFNLRKRHNSVNIKGIGVELLSEYYLNNSYFSNSLFIFEEILTYYDKLLHRNEYLALACSRHCIETRQRKERCHG